MKAKSFNDLFAKAEKRLGYWIEHCFLCDNFPDREDEARANLEKFVKANYVKKETYNDLKKKLAKQKH